MSGKICYINLLDRDRYSEEKLILKKIKKNKK